MSLRKASAIAVVLAASACGGGSGSGSIANSAQDAKNAPAASGDAANAPPSAANGTTLSSGSVTSTGTTHASDGTSNPIAVNPSVSKQGDLPVAHDTKIRWTDAQIVAATAAADAAQEADARLARERSKTARVERFAQQMVVDQRDLDAQQARIGRVISASPSDISARVEEARRPLSEAAHGTSLTFDKDFLAAQIDYSKKLIALIDEELLPSATSPDLKSYLQALRAKTASHLLQAQEIVTQLP